MNRETNVLMSIKDYELRNYVVSMQVDCRVDVVVYATDEDDLRAEANRADYDMKDLDVIETHLVNATDVVTNEVTDLC